MRPENFDNLARTLANGMSRRHILKLLAASVLTGIGIRDGQRTSEAELADQSSSSANKIFLPLVRKNTSDFSGIPTFKIANAAEVQAILQQADQDNDFKVLQATLIRGGLTSVAQEGAFILKNGTVVARAAVVHYQPSNSLERAYLIFGTNNRNEHIVVTLHFEVANRIGYGRYRDAQGAVQVELVDFKAASVSGEQRKESSTDQESIAAVSESCQICHDSCVATQELRQGSCVIRSTIAAINVGMAAREELVDLSLDVARIIGNIDTIHSGLGGIQECIDQGPLDCTANGLMCQQVCKPCTSSNGSSCVCVGGECRTTCGSNLCRSTETCGGNGRCTPLANTCGPYTYMGLYRLGNRLAPACCAITGGINCGAALNGIWGGCCPAGTLCKPIGIGYGCCTPGLNCD